VLENYVSLVGVRRAAKCQQLVGRAPFHARTGAAESGPVVLPQMRTTALVASSTWRRTPVGASSQSSAPWPATKRRCC
jgi:hypothetical protein